MTVNNRNAYTAKWTIKKRTQLNEIGFSKRKNVNSRMHTMKQDILIIIKKKNIIKTHKIFRHKWQQIFADF